jgi:rubrerythrin
MGLSQDTAERLTECFVSKTGAPEEKTYDFSWGGQWYCPGCGVAAREEEQGVVRCPECKRSLSSFIYELIEIHPHVGRDY